MSKNNLQPMFRGELEFLSNFWMEPFFVSGLGLVKSSEHAFNALKTTDVEMREWVLSADAPQEAKNRGRRVPLRDGWDSGVRDEIMREVLTKKFSIAHLREKLVATGNLTLVETNLWHDQYWGDCICAKHSDEPGVNQLGKTLMELRNALSV